MLGARGRIAREERRKDGQEGEETCHPDDRRGKGGRQAPAAAQVEGPGERQDSEDNVRRGDLGGKKCEENEEGEETVAKCHSARFPFPVSRFPAHLIGLRTPEAPRRSA